MSDTNNTKIAGLPYFEDYLREVLRPRVERIIQRDQASWQDMVWQAVVRQMLSEQPAGSHLDAETIERILREVLGLRIDANVTASFDGQVVGDHDAPANDRAGLAMTSPARQETAAGQDGMVVDRRNEGNPLLRAVVGPRRVGR